MRQGFGQSKTFLWSFNFKFESILGNGKAAYIAQVKSG